MNQELFNIVLGILAFLAAFVFKVMWDKIEKERDARADLEKEHAEDLAILQKEFAEKLAGYGNIFVRRDDFKDHVDKVSAALDRIEGKLDAKQDRRKRA